MKPWLPWTEDAATNLKEGTVAWLTWNGAVQSRPYVWLYAEQAECFTWFTAAPDGDSEIEGQSRLLTHYLPIEIPEGP